MYEKGVVKRAHDERIIVCEWPIYEVKSNTTFVNDKVAVNRGSGFIDYFDSESCLDETEDIACCKKWLA
jgi:hypothetical protein